VGDGGWWIEERGEHSAGYIITEMKILRKLASNTAYRTMITTKCRMAEWQDGGMAEWRDGGMAEGRNDGMVFYYIPNLSCYIYGTRRQCR
jgi:hypothetical protein